MSAQNLLILKQIRLYGKQFIFAFLFFSAQAKFAELIMLMFNQILNRLSFEQTCTKNKQMIFTNYFKCGIFHH